METLWMPSKGHCDTYVTVRKTINTFVASRGSTTRTNEPLYCISHLWVVARVEFKVYDRILSFHLNMSNITNKELIEVLMQEPAQARGAGNEAELSEHFWIRIEDRSF